MMSTKNANHTHCNNQQQLEKQQMRQGEDATSETVQADDTKQSVDGSFSLAVVNQKSVSSRNNHTKLKASQSQRTLAKGPSSNSRSMAQLKQQQDGSTSLIQHQKGSGQRAQGTIQSQLQLLNEDVALKLSGKMMKAAHHRRKSSERFVTNEGPRKMIRDFDVFEMQGRQKAAQSFKHVSKHTTTVGGGHQTKRITTSKQQLSGNPSGQQKTATKKNGINGKTRKKSCSLYKDDCQNLPKTVQVEDLVVQRHTHKFSASLFGGLGSSEFSLGETSAQQTTSRRVMSPKLGISVATINLTGVDRSESYKHDRSGIESPSLFPSSGQQPLDESNQVAVSMLSSLNGTQFQTLQHACSLALETHSSSGKVPNTRANPQEDRSYQTLNISRPFPKNIVTQEEEEGEESFSAIQSEDPLHNPSAESSASQTTKKLTENAPVSSGMKSSVSKNGSVVDHRRCLTAEFSFLTGASNGKGRASLEQLETFDSKNLSLGQTSIRSTKPQTTTKKSQRHLHQKNGALKIGQISLEETKDVRSIKIKVQPQTTRHSSTSFGFNGLTTASKGSLANKIIPSSQVATGASVSQAKKTPPLQHNTQLRHAKSSRSSIVQAPPSDGATKHSFVSKAVMSQQKLTSLAPKFAAAKIMKHSSTVAKPGSAIAKANKQPKGQQRQAQPSGHLNPSSSTSSILVSQSHNQQQQGYDTAAIQSSQTTKTATSQSQNNLHKLTTRKASVGQQQKQTRTKKDLPHVLQAKQRSVAATAMSLDRKNVVEEDSAQAQQNNRNKTSLKTYMETNVKKKECAVAVQQLGSSSLTRKDSQNHKAHGGVSTNKINVSNFNSTSSLNVLNQSSQVSNHNTVVSLTTYASVPKQSSLKKQQVLKKVPHASSFLDQAKDKQSSTKKCRKNYETQDRHQITNTEQLEKQMAQAYATVTSTLAQPRVSLQSQTKKCVNPENTNNDTCESGKQIKKVPRHLIRASSCSGLTSTTQAADKRTVSKITFSRQLSRDLSKPKTKCQFTQLQIIRQKDSSAGSGSIGNEQNSTSRIDDYSKTYSSNPSTVAIPPSIKMQRQASARDNTCRQLIKQAISSASIPGGGNQQTNQTAQRFDTQANRSSINADVRFSAKEILSTLGKETLSQFDFSNGLPDCLRSNQERKRGHPGDTSSNGKTSFNDFNLALLNRESAAPFAAPREESSKVDHKAFLQDFISNEPAEQELALSDSKGDAILEILQGENPYSASTLDVEFLGGPEFSKFQSSKEMVEQQHLDSSTRDFGTRKHSYHQETVKNQYFKQGQKMVTAAQQSIVKQNSEDDDQSHQLLASSFLSTDPNQQCCSQMTYSKFSKQSPQQLQMTLRGSSNLPLDASLLKQSQSIFKYSGNSALKHKLSLSQSKFLKSNNSGAQSTYKHISGTSGDEPLWTLSNEDITSRHAPEDDQDMVFKDLPPATTEQPGEQIQRQEIPRRSDELAFEDCGAETQEEGRKGDFDIMSQRDLVSVSDANRPSIDQMLPTRYSQLLLDSQQESSARMINRETQMLMLTPTDGSSTYLGRKKRLLDQHMGAQRITTTFMAARDSKLVLPFERVSSDMIAEADSRDGDLQEELILNNEESTIREDEYGDESGLGRDFAAGQERLPNQVEAQNLHPEAEPVSFSVMEGVQLDKGMADRWLNNQDQLRPKVIEDEDDDDDDDQNTSRSNFCD